MRKVDPEKINFILGEEESGFKTIKIEDERKEEQGNLALGLDGGGQTGN